jgi:hypothetical protein
MKRIAPLLSPFWPDFHGRKASCAKCSIAASGGKLAYGHTRFVASLVESGGWLLTGPGERYLALRYLAQAVGLNAEVIQQVIAHLIVG